MPTLRRIIRPFLLLPALCLTLAALCAMPCTAAALSRDEAVQILYDTHTIAGYVGLYGEPSYAGKPQNVLAAALFGAYDAKMMFRYQQDQRREEGKKPLPPSSPLFTAGGRSLAASQVLTRDDAPDLFRGLPEQYSAFVSREAAEIAALRYTGHAVKQHAAPAGNEFLGEVILNGKGYFVCIDGLGDLMHEPVLRQLSQKGSGFLLSGDIEQVMGDEGNAVPDTFTLELAPGDAPGTWKRQYVITPGS